jgi:hypothetical protein
MALMIGLIGLMGTRVVMADRNGRNDSNLLNEGGSSTQFIVVAAVAGRLSHRTWTERAKSLSLSLCGETDKENHETLSVASSLLQQGAAFAVLKPGHLGKAIVHCYQVAQR